MKKTFFAWIGLAICLAMGVSSLPVCEMTVEASELKTTTVQGTIKKGTTTTMLYLDTQHGEMEIKIDSNADTSGCKLLLPGKKIYATVYRGNDAYMHVNKITSAAPSTTVSLDTSSKSTVSAKIKENSTDEILYVSTPQGDMEIKLDSTTDLSGISVLVVDKTYNIVCVRGNDAYMHATSISEANTTVTSSVTGINAATASGPSVSGTVSKNTTENILYLNTNCGEMQFKLDSNTNTLYGMVHVPGSALTVYYTHGSDGYLHATTVAGTRSASNATLSGSTSTVSGTVDSKSTESVLYLSTQHGMMELKLDSVTSLNNCKALVTGKWVSVSCMRGSDAYMHAIAING